MKTAHLILLICFITVSSVYFLSSCQKTSASEVDNENYPKALSSYNEFKNLVTEVEQHRSERLVNLNEFLKMKSEPNTIILDTRSTDRYDEKHVKGAIHLAFTDFTQSNLLKLIPDPNTRILIYCNNNFMGDQINFATKTASPVASNVMLQNIKPITLALNIPTYINLYGYGYRNVYELNELVKIDDSRISFEGSKK